MTATTTVALDALHAEEVVIGVLVELDLPGGVQRAWNGLVPLQTHDGRLWRPLAAFGAVGELEGGSAMESPGFSLGLALPEAEREAAEAFARAVRAARETDLFGRWATIWLQLFDPDDLRLLGPPRAAAAGVMVQVEDRWEGVSGVSLRLVCEHVLTAALSGADGWMTDADQQARHPGDRGLELAAAIVERPVTWPRD